ncbi:sensor domain-containing diguanylate cyclase [Siccibacter colletis]|uniref:Sensor domain-containing phosphodiesterase n=1 Tax=Siccibacter colletis TaxID=1505757 RepID=A0ABY6JL47_9ENTR|nr:sensor domain-containing phosphodiesterase [Siccibacter colletis]UYU33614.1 sensor domain-containing phosphodiesterase [Siccibacter colletis]
MFSGLNKHQSKKLAAVELLRQEDGTRDRTLGEFARLAKSIMGVEGCFVTVFDNNFQYIKFAENVPHLLEKMPVDEAMCQYSVLTCEPVICQDTRLDERFIDHPLVQRGVVIFYAAAPLTTRDGLALGTLCVSHASPVMPSPERIAQFIQLAGLASAWLDTWYSVGRIDALTGLPNRQTLLKEMDRLSFAGVDEPLVMMIFDCIDITRAYELSRYLGLAAVEKLLRNFGPLLRMRLRLTPDVPLYAFAAERYALLVNNKLARTLIKRTLALPPTRAKIAGDTEIPLRTHAGYASFIPNQDSGQEVFRQAVSALHEAIRQGNTVQAFDAVLDGKRNDDFRLLYDLGEAVKNGGELYLVYQPKVSLHDGRTVGLEALLRWTHPQMGDIPPSKIVALAERTSLMTAITDWVTAEVLRQLICWRSVGIMLPVSINVTVSDFSAPGFADALEAKVLAAGLTPADLRIECLETEKVLESATALQELDMLKLRGFKILLDDFGAGYSNINYLRRIPIDIIKLDRTLISQITRDTGSRVIARNVIVMLKELDYLVLAEGVEDADTARLLKTFGCDEIQGYFCSRPIPPAEIAGWLEQHDPFCGM